LSATTGKTQTASIANPLALQPFACGQFQAHESFNSSWPILVRHVIVLQSELAPDGGCCPFQFSRSLNQTCGCVPISIVDRRIQMKIACRSLGEIGAVLEFVIRQNTDDQELAQVAETRGRFAATSVESNGQLFAI
jgi:hypothetical protein